MKTKLNKNSQWLLKWIYYSPHQCVTRTTSMPCDKPAGISMLTVRGLERAGMLAKDNNHLFRITEKGKTTVAELSAVTI